MTERVYRTTCFRVAAGLLASCASLAFAGAAVAQSDVLPSEQSTLSAAQLIAEADEAFLVSQVLSAGEDFVQTGPGEASGESPGAEAHVGGDALAPESEVPAAVSAPAEVPAAELVEVQPAAAPDEAVTEEAVVPASGVKALFAAEKAAFKAENPPPLPARSFALSESGSAASHGSSENADPGSAAADEPNGLPEVRTPAPGSEWLKDLVEQVLERQPELAEAGAVQRQARARYRAAKAAALPQISSGLSFGREVQEKQGLTQTFGPQYSGNVGLSVPLFNQTVVAKARQARIHELAVDWQTVTARDRLVLRTVEIYAELVRQSRLLELARENLVSHRRYVGQMKEVARKDLGRAADLPLAEARVSLAEAVLSSRLAKLEEVRVQWRALSGLPAPDEAPATPLFDVMRDLPDVVLPTSLEVALQEAVEWSPALQKVIADQAAAEASVEVARSAILPRIDGGAHARAGRDYGSIPGRQSSWYVGASVQWDWGVGQVHERRAAREGAAAASSAVDVELRRLKAGVESQWYEMLAAQAAARTYEGYVRQSESVVRSYTEQFRIGRRSLLDVLNAENELFTAKSNLTTARIDQQIAAWRLASLRGQAVEELGL